MPTNKAFKKAEELTGVHVELREVTTTANSEQFGIAVASGDLPNVLTNVGMLWTSSFEQGIEDEVLMDLTDLTENYMPAYKECYDQLDDDTKRELHTDSGYMPKLITINNYPDGATEGAFIRTDYLEKIGMDIPTTYDELDKVLRAFQTELGLAEPLMATAGIVHTSNALCSGFDVNGGFSTFPMIAEPYYIVDGQVKYGIVEPASRSTWRCSPPIIRTASSAPTSSPRTPTPWSSPAPSPPATWAYSSARPTWFPTTSRWARPPIPTLRSLLCRPSPKEPGQATHFGTVKSPISGRVAAISLSTAEVDLEKMGKYLDFFFTDEGALLSSMGVEGNDDGSYVFDENGDLQYSDYWNNYEGLTENEKPTLFIYSVMPMLKPKTPSSYSMDVQFDCAPTWDTNADSSYRMPDAISLTADETTEYQAIYSDIQTTIEENLTKFAVGERSMDEWDSFVEEIKSMGIDDCIAIKQAAVERYYDRTV